MKNILWSILIFLFIRLLFHKRSIIILSGNWSFSCNSPTLRVPPGYWTRTAFLLSLANLYCSSELSSSIAWIAASWDFFSPMVALRPISAFSLFSVASIQWYNSKQFLSKSFNPLMYDSSACFASSSSVR